jgi:hypothetical protein
VRKRAGVISSAPPFRDGSQRASTCRRLLELVDASERWTPTGPAPSGQNSQAKGG